MYTLDIKPRRKKMNQNTKIILLVVLSMFAPFLGIPLLIIMLLKNKNSEQSTSDTQQINNEQKIKVENKILNNQIEQQPVEQTSNNANGRIPKPLLTILIVLSGASLFFMLLGIILALTVPNEIGKNMLLITGTIEIFVAIIGLVIMYRKMLYTCPECGTKREHHKHFVETKTQARNQPNNTYRSEKSVFVSCLITTYRYKYCHTYVCPNCGETETTESWENGGQVYQYIDGLTVDKRKDIKEF